MVNHPNRSKTGRSQLTQIAAALRFDLRRQIKFGPDFNQAVKDSVERLEALAAEAEWRPIETAPCEEAILTFCVNEPGVIRNLPIVAIQRRYTPMSGMEVRRKWVSPIHEKSLYPPTHWMPLPPPPSEGAT